MGWMLQHKSKALQQAKGYLLFAISLHHKCLLGCTFFCWDGCLDVLDCMHSPLALSQSTRSAKLTLPPSLYIYISAYSVNSYFCSLAEALDMQPPVMPEDGHTTRLTTGEDASPPVSGKDSSVLEAIWDDEDTRAFYECLPDLRFVLVRYYMLIDSHF